MFCSRKRFSVSPYSRPRELLYHASLDKCTKHGVTPHQSHHCLDNVFSHLLTFLPTYLQYCGKWEFWSTAQVTSLNVSRSSTDATPRTKGTEAPSRCRTNGYRHIQDMASNDCHSYLFMPPIHIILTNTSHSSIIEDIAFSYPLLEKQRVLLATLFSSLSVRTDVLFFLVSRTYIHLLLPQ